MSSSIKNQKDSTEVSGTGEQTHSSELYYCKLLLFTTHYMSYFVTCTGKLSNKEDSCWTHVTHWKEE